MEENLYSTQIWEPYMAFVQLFSLIFDEIHFYN